MIVYRKTFLGLHLIFRIYGSAILRTAVWGAVAALQTGLLYAFAQGYVDRYFTDGRVTVYSVLVALVSLVVIFRNNARQEGLAARAERGWQPVWRRLPACVDWRASGQGWEVFRGRRGAAAVRRVSGASR
jgi:hypothetical protein